MVPMKAVRPDVAKPERPQAALTVNTPKLLPDGSDLDFRHFVHDALAFASRLQAVRDEFARLIGLTGVQYTILISIYHLEYEQRVGITTVASHLHLSGTFVTTETNKLAKLGLVDKARDDEDRRRINLRTTARARNLLSELAEVQSHVNDVHFSPLGAEDFNRLKHLMPALVTSTDRALRLLAAASLPDKNQSTTDAVLRDGRSITEASS